MVIAPPPPPPVTFEVTGHDITISKAGSNAFSVNEEVKYVLKLSKDCASYASWFLDPYQRGEASFVSEDLEDDVLCDEIPLDSGKFKPHSVATMRRGTVLLEVNIRPKTSIWITLPAPRFPEKSVPMWPSLRRDKIVQVPVPSEPREVKFDLKGGTIEVLVADIPQNSFYQAKGAQELRKNSYSGQEEVKWSLNHSGQDVKFDYIPTPYHHIRPILSPVLDMSSLSKWLIGIIGFLGTTILTVIAKPVLFKPATAKQRL